MDRTSGGFLSRDALWSVLLILFLVAGLITLVQSETPRGRVAGIVIAKETNQPLPNAWGNFNAESKEGGTWSFRTDSQGRFSIPEMPAGTYSLYVYTRAHRLELKAFQLQEGERQELTLALEPQEPFLNIINPQAVHLPGEEVKIGITGFVPNRDTLKTTIYRLALPDRMSVAMNDLIDTLETTRNGWWYGSDRWRKQLAKLRPLLKTVSVEESPIKGRDVEGVFLHYLPLKLPAEGIYLVELDAGTMRQVALVSVTSVALISKYAEDGAVYAWTTDLRSGKPIANVAVEGWNDQREAGHSTARKLSEAQTNNEGIARLNAGRAQNGSQQMYLIARMGSQRAPVAWVKLWNPYAPRVDQNLNGAIYSDRPVYRPGHTVHFKGILREKTGSGYRMLASNTPVRVSVTDPNDNEIYRKELSLQGFSRFHGSLTLNPEAKSGSYSVTAQVNGRQVNGRFQVAAYRKPTFKIKMTPSQKFYLPNESARIELNADYYFGMPVGGAKVYYTLYRMPLYSWMEYDPEEAAFFEEEYEYSYYGEYVMNGETRADDQGRAFISISPSDLKPKNERTSPYDSPSGYRYTVQATVEAGGYEYVEAKTEFKVVPGAWQIGLHTEPSFTLPNQPVTFRLVVTDRETEAPQQTTVTWRAGLVEWRGQQEEVLWDPIQGGQSGSVTTNEKGEAAWEFNTDRAGSWIVEITTVDPKGNRIVTRDWLWVSDYRRDYPRPPSMPALQIETDKRAYQPGETLRLAVRSRVQEGWVWVTLEGDQLKESRVVALKNGEAMVEIPIDAGSIPSAYVSACLVSQKRFSSQTESIRVGSQDQKLKLSIQTDKTQYEPRETVQIRVQATTETGKPVQTDLSLAVVDESIYAIREDNPNLLYNTFYARRANRVGTVYSFPWLALQGDKGTSETVRREFLDTALWLPALMTDANGRASASVRLPDNLTQWRVTAVGHTQNTSVGYQTAKFTCAKEFMARLSIPPVMTEGDTVTASAILSNNGSQEQQATVEFVDGSQTRSQQTRVEPGKSVTLTWDYQAGEATASLPLLIRARTDSGKQDAEEKRIAILPFAFKQQVNRNLWLNNSNGAFSFTIDDASVLNYSKLEAHIAPSLFSPIARALEYLIGYPYGCTEQTISQFVATLLAFRALKEQGFDVSEYERVVPDMVQTGLGRLYRFQTYSNGWGWWEADTTNLFMTAYVMRGLTLAQRMGAPVNDRVYNTGRGALQQLIEQTLSYPSDPERFDWDDYAYALFAYAESGGGFNPQYLQWQNRKGYPMTTYGQTMIALALHRWGRADQAQAILDSVLRSAERTGIGLHWNSTRAEQPYRWITDEETTAWVMIAAMRLNTLTPGELQSVAEWLLSRRQGGGWYSTKDTAAILEALVEYTLRYWQPGSSAGSAELTFELNGVAIGTHRVEPGDSFRPETVLPVDLRSLGQGEHTLSVKSKGGKPVFVSVQFMHSRRLPESESPVVSGKQTLERTYWLVRSVGTDRNGNPVVNESRLQSGDSVPAGSLIRVKIRGKGWKETGASHLILEDPLPAGCRPSVADLPTSLETEYGYNNFYAQETRDDRVLAYCHYLWSDELEYDYLLRAEVPGEYRMLPAQVATMYRDLSAQSGAFRLKISR
ncbi:MAG: hypothetical protein KIT45_06285 [Fimbriimonadia bacterium]|nr:hypothetical protein [Fimbriimonadia bacterium]